MKSVNNSGKKSKLKPESKKGFGKYLDYLKKFWHFLWYDDSLLSYIVSFFVAFIIIKYIFFPFLGFTLNNDFPIVAIVSGSMEHKIVNHQICDKYVTDVDSKRLDYEEFWGFCGSYYVSNYNITKEQFQEFDYNKGLNIGDVMVLYGEDPEDIEIGEVLVFVPQDRAFFEQKGPVIHRVVDKWVDEEGKYHFKTKGDHNPKTFDNFENDIHEDNVIAVAVVRVPFIGYAKIALNSALMGVVNLVR